MSHPSNCFVSECPSVWQFGFRKWKSHVTERPFEDRSEVVKELYSELNTVKPHSGTCGKDLLVKSDSH